MSALQKHFRAGEEKKGTLEGVGVFSGVWSESWFLQVEQLFCLGLRSRSECLKLLETCDWNLEVASTQMLDSYGSTARQR